LEGFGEFGEIAPGKDAMPFGACFVFAFVVLPAFLGGDVEDDVLFVVLSGFGFCVLPVASRIICRSVSELFVVSGVSQDR
jgi:hypothetical protein